MVELWSVPICRLMERIVRSGLVMAWRLATSPTKTSPDLEKATTDGVVREPSAFGITVGSPPSRTETTELVVPRSIPTALAMFILLWLDLYLSDFKYFNLSLGLSTFGRPAMFPAGVANFHIFSPTRALSH